MEGRRLKIQFDIDEPTVFFRKLRRIAEAEEWTAKKVNHRALFEISDSQEWVATRLEEKLGIQPTGEEENGSYPSIDALQTATLEICDPRSTKHVLLDRFERVKLVKPVEQTRGILQDLFQRAVPEASKETVDLFILRQLIRSAPEPWQLQLREADLKTVEEVEEKIRREEQFA